MIKIESSNGTAMKMQPRKTGDCRYPVLHLAVREATEWHLYQDRKYSALPYIVHPLRVMRVVGTVTNDEEMLCAAVLHDVVEDTPATLNDLRQTFSDRVVELVDWLTDVAKPEDGNRTARRHIDLLHTAEAPADAQTIKLADLIDNTQSITKADPDFARVYMSEKEKLLQVLTKGHPALLDQATQLLQNYQRNLIQESLRRG